MIAHLSCLAWLLTCPLQDSAPRPEDPVLDERDLARRVIEGIDADRLSGWHDLAAGRPHVAGTDGDAAQIAWMVEAFEDLGLEVERQELELYLCRPVSASLDIVEPRAMSLSLKEKLVEGDPYVGDERLDFGWNAYSGSGTAEGPVVYANYGRLEDFERLRELGVDCTGKVVVARYGGNYRGYKAKFAEAAGAAALVIYSDPADVGYRRGDPWPSGGWANETSIQRGSIKTLPYYGDPQTPFVPSTKGAERIDPAKLALPTIPVQPCGWAAAYEILARMDGDAVPLGWEGALDLDYVLEGGDELIVRVQVEQERLVLPTSNVIATLRGRETPEDAIVLGCHHDSWNFGAADATCGLISMFEAARSFAAARDAGHVPRRSIRFAAWGAEEFGILGSSEWVEANFKDLREHCIAYINLDMASMGLDFGASASPLLFGPIRDAATLVPHPAFDDGRPVFDVWSRRARVGADSDDPDGPPRIGTLGGGSDHVGFLALGLVPSASFSGSGSRGNCYHSNYDHLHWYRRVVGDDYLASRMIAQMAAATATLLADSPVLPYDLRALPKELEGHLRSLTVRGRRLDFFDAVVDSEIAYELRQLKMHVRNLRKATGLVWGTIQRSPSLPLETRTELNARLRELETSFHLPEGLPERPWFKNLYVAPDETSGYAAWALPLLRRSVEENDFRAFEAALVVYRRSLGLLTSRLEDIYEWLREQR